MSYKCILKEYLMKPLFLEVLLLVPVPQGVGFQVCHSNLIYSWDGISLKEKSTGFPLSNESLCMICF